MRIPEQLVRNCQKTPERQAWLDGLPDLLTQLEFRWSIRIGEPFENATCSWAAPVACTSAYPAILKVAMPHMEGRDEIRGLQFWSGDGTVRLLEAEVESGAMLIERCMPGSTLHSEHESRQDEIIAQMLKRIWRHTSPESSLSCFRPLSQLIEFWNDETTYQRHFWIDSVLVIEGLTVMAELAKPSSTDVLLTTDLHADNVLRSEREPWLVIDPKPFIGDRSYDLVQHLFNCEARLHADPLGLVDRLADLAEVDSERLRLWTFARAAADPRDDWEDTRWLGTARALAP
jgi:streptomycin 6-kinase